MSEPPPPSTDEPQIPAPDAEFSGAEAPDAAADDPLNKALMEAAQWKEVALRSAAELDNYRKRMAREMQDAARYANAGLLEALLPVLDNFDYGLQAARAENEKSNIFIGMSMVLKQMQDFLRDQGVEEIAPTGAFDPNLHEAMSQQPSDSVAEGHIIYHTRRGYRLRDRLLRPASVVVSSGPAKSA